MGSDRRRRERGALLGLVLVLLAVVLMASGIAMWSVRGDSASAGADRLERQLFDCAERGLEWGKQFFSGNGSDWSSYLAANDVCGGESPLPCPPFHNGPSAPPPGYPYVATVTMGGQSVTSGSTRFTSASERFTYTVAIFDNDELAEGASQDWFHDSDGNIVVYSVCTDPQSRRQKAVQAMIRVRVPTNIDYTGQAAFGFRNQGNRN
jgi:hypothetical protein